MDDDGIRFSCTEQYMHYKKATLFNDFKTAELILLAKKPAMQKALGRRVKNFDPVVWDKHKEQIVTIGNVYKFTQNQDLLEKLKLTKGLLVEASPTDTVWGIGMSVHDPDIHDKTKWKGDNLLGYILTKLRDNLTCEVISM